MSRVVVWIAVRCMLGKYAYDKYKYEFAREFLTIEKYVFSPLVMLASWFPSSQQRQFRAARARIFSLIDLITCDFIENRVPEEDRSSYIGFLIDKSSVRSTYPDALANHILLILIGAHVNTAANMGWAFVHLNRNQETLKTIRAEQESFIKQYGTAINLDLINQMTYLDALMKETLRCSGVPLLLRKVMTNVELPNSRNVSGTGPVVIPKGHMVAISPQLIHNDPLVYENPNKFDLTRWDTAEKVAARKVDLSYSHFGWGRHPCPGERFATLGAKLVWLDLLRRFDLEILEGLQAQPDFGVCNGSPFPDRHIYVRLVPLKQPLV